MWQTQDERKLLLFMQLYQQWLQVAAATLHIEEREEQRRRRKEERRRMEARRIATEAVRREYGAVRTDLSAASAAYVKHEITFKIGLRIAADRGGNPQTQYGYSTHTVRIPRGSRRIEHPPRSALQHPCVGVKGVLPKQSNTHG